MKHIYLFLFSFFIINIVFSLDLTKELRESDQFSEIIVESNADESVILLKKSALFDVSSKELFFNDNFIEIKIENVRFVLNSMVKNFGDKLVYRVEAKNTAPKTMTLKIFVRAHPPGLEERVVTEDSESTFFIRFKKPIMVGTLSQNAPKVTTDSTLIAKKYLEGERNSGIETQKVVKFPIKKDEPVRNAMAKKEMEQNLTLVPSFQIAKESDEKAFAYKENKEVQSYDKTIFKLILSLIFVVGLIVALGFAYKRLAVSGKIKFLSGLQKNNYRPIIEVVGTHYLSSKRTLQIIKVMEEFLLISSHEQGVTLLSKLGSDPTEDQALSDVNQFKKILNSKERSGNTKSKDSKDSYARKLDESLDTKPITISDLKNAIQKDVTQNKINELFSDN